MARLNLTKTTVVAPDMETKLRSAFDILDEVKTQVRDMGLPEYPKPRGNPTPLADLDTSTLGNDELGALYTQYVAFAQYVGARVAEAEAAHRIGVSNLKKLEASLKIQLFKEDTPKSEVVARVKEHPLYIQFEIEVLKLFAMKELLSANHTAYDKQASALSRVITLRELEFKESLRENGISSRKTKVVAGQVRDLRK